MSPSPSAAWRTDHVGLTVGDLPAMTRWYCDAFGLEVEFEFALEQVAFRGVMLRGASLWELWADVLALLAFTTVMMTAAILRFRKRLD